ncbi:ARM repeat-containing protein [Neoconidiobolus thromboides FSU 785]|nr:ARM repeat-containing protein [Neoconidiobolus thromboides FSU 785]
MSESKTINPENQVKASNNEDELLPFPSLPPNTTESSTHQRPKPRLNVVRRGRADTLPPSFSYSFPFSPPPPPPGLKNSNSNSDLKAISTSSIPTPKSIPSLGRTNSSGNRMRGATFSVPPSSLPPQFAHPNPYGSFYSNNSLPSMKGGLQAVDESEQAIIKHLGLDDHDNGPNEQKRNLPESKTIAALKNLGRNRSRSFNVAGNYNDSQQMNNNPPNINTTPPQPRLTLRQARARAISVGFLNQEELFDAFPELDALIDSDDEKNSHLQISQRIQEETSWASQDYEDEYNEMAPPPLPSRSLWVGNLDPNVSSNDLLALFSPYGPIESLRVLPEKECAFVNFHSLEDAIKAKDDMQGGRMGSLNIRIGFGKADPTYATTTEVQTTNPTRALWIGNISASTSSAILQSIFSNFGIVESARVLVHKNCGFVNFTTVEAAQKARDTMNGKEISGSVVRIGYGKAPPPGETSNKTNRPINPIPLSQLGIQLDEVQSPISDNSFNEIKGNKENKEDNMNQLEESINKMKLEENINNPNYGVYENGNLLGMDEKLVSFPYKSIVPNLPNNEIRIDQNTLKEKRKGLDGHVHSDNYNRIFDELFELAVELCTDYVGNTIIQKMMEKGDIEHRTLLIKKVSPYMASIGCHKNGTWAIQKMIDCATTDEQFKIISESLKPYTPPLLLDQYGNYVVQCCLKFGPKYNQFIFDAIHARFWDIVHGRFGTRAVRTCLDSKFSNNQQKKLVAIALVNHGLFLSTDANGSILITWLLDTSTVSGRYRSLVPQFSVHLPVLCTHKLASLTILKIINQRIEPDARENLIEAIFFTEDESVLEAVLSDSNYGLGLVQKILQSSCISMETKDKIADKVRLTLNQLQLNHNHIYGQLINDLANHNNENENNMNSNNNGFY